MRKVSSANIARGRAGESRASEYLTESGYRILARNYRTRRGEIDIIAGKGSELVFAEVKCWKSNGLGDLEISIGKRKQARIIEASRVYLMQRGLSDRVSVRYDVIFVEGDSMEVYHVPAAFTGNTW